MTTNETFAAIDEASARWVSRLDRAPLDKVEREEFVAWLSRSPRHRGAYMRAQTVLAAAQQAMLATPCEPGPESRSTGARSKASRRKLLLAALSVGAAGVAASVLFTVFFDQPFTNYRSQRGEVRVLPMTDGTIATLNTATEISVRITRSAREVRLIRGEALFVVEKDTERPFTVSMGDTVVRAVGTAFVVRNIKDEPAQVLVGEGAVDMYRRSVEGTAPLRVPANARAVALEVPSPSVKMLEEGLDPALVARQLAWREGMISFDGQSLKQAAAEFKRYSDVDIVIDDPAVARLTVLGLFAANNPIEFAHSAAAILNLQVKETPTGIMLYRQ